MVFPAASIIANLVPLFFYPSNQVAGPSIIDSQTEHAGNRNYSVENVFDENFRTVHVTCISTGMAADSFIVCDFWVAIKLDRFVLYQHGDNNDFVNIFDMTSFNSDDFSNSSVLWFENSFIDFEVQGNDSIN